MKNSILNGFKMPIFVLAASFAGVAHAEIYKCSYMDDTKRRQTVYTDAPCGKTLPKLPARVMPDNAEALDQAVTRAVLAGDFKLAKQLASTKEHWRLIAVAEKPAATAAPSEIQQKAYQQSPCERATADFDYNSQHHWRDSSLINAKRSIMYASCGVTEPMQQPSPVIVGQYYGQQLGGITTSRWIAPHAGFGYGQPHGYAHPPKPHHPHINRHTDYAPQGLSIGYQNRNFGVRFGSFSSSNVTYSNTTAW